MCKSKQQCTSDITTPLTSKSAIAKLITKIFPFMWTLLSRTIENITVKFPIVPKTTMSVKYKTSAIIWGWEMLCPVPLGHALIGPSMTEVKIWPFATVEALSPPNMDMSRHRKYQLFKKQSVYDRDFGKCRNYEYCCHCSFQKFSICLLREKLQNFWTNSFQTTFLQIPTTINTLSYSPRLKL